jgi:hypothetical protein
MPFTDKFYNTFVRDRIYEPDIPFAYLSNDIPAVGTPVHLHFRRVTITNVKEMNRIIMFNTRPKIDEQSKMHLWICSSIALANLHIYNFQNISDVSITLHYYDYFNSKIIKESSPLLKKVTATDCKNKIWVPLLDNPLIITTNGMNALPLCTSINGTLCQACMSIDATISDVTSNVQPSVVIKYDEITVHGDIHNKIMKCNPSKILKYNSSTTIKC